MTTMRLDLRRPAPKRAGNLFRVTAAVSFLSLPLLWVVYLLYPLPQLDSCRRVEGGEPCPPSIDRVGRSVDELDLFLATVGVELIAIGCYLALATARGSLEWRTGLRWSPVAGAVVALAVGGFGPLIDDGDLNGVESVRLGFLLLFALWLLTPLVLYCVYRADRHAAVPVAVGLAPTAATNALVIPDDPVAALPAVMLVAGVLTLLVVRRRK